jgi:2-oxoglutarate dehydrogenase E2 component (dihydrolipoamide succinyltransferase)
MNEEITINLPKLGESIVSATVVQWFKKEGDEIALDEPLLEVSTDKVNSEIPSPVAGRLVKILATADQELAVGEPLAIIAAVKKGQVEEKVMPPRAAQPCQAAANSSCDFLSPAVLRTAQELQISTSELKDITGTGAEGRITRQDVEAYASRKHAPQITEASSAVSADVERLKMSGMRKAIADNMVRSFYEAPHATLVNEVDVTDVLALIAKEKEAFQQKWGAKLTVTSFVARAIVKALIDYPLINSSLEQDTILVKKFINLGIAVSIDNGLMVPVVKHCQKMSLGQIAHAIHEVSLKARSSTLSPDDVSGGTISMTNFGMSGVAIGVPIIRYPEVAIIGVGAIQKRVAVIDDDKMAIRSLMHISLTFDHRVLDGMYGCGFLAAVRKHLESDLSI